MPMEMIENKGYEEVSYIHDKESGLRAFISLHNTFRGPGLGGTRLWTYNNIEDGLLDVLRLSEGMTYKAAVAGLKLGGGKAVILADGNETNKEIRGARFRKFGEFVEQFNGRYITSEDVGTSPVDMGNIRKSTQHVVGLPVAAGGSGDPSPMTAFGVHVGMKALVSTVMDRDSLKDIRVAIQGLGHVGMDLVRRLKDDGAIIYATDINKDLTKSAQENFGIEIVEPDKILSLNVDVLAPCALGGVINDKSIEELNCSIVAGCANNQLLDWRHGEMLHEMGIAYAVDYVINAGGLINVFNELNGYDEENAKLNTAEIYNTIIQMMIMSKEKNISTQEAAKNMALIALEKIDQSASNAVAMDSVSP